MVNNTSQILAASSQQDLEDEEEDVDSFDLTPELQHVGILGEKGATPSANNNVVAGFMDTPGAVPPQQQQALGNLNHVSSPTTPVATASAGAASVGVPVIPGVGTSVAGASGVAGGKGKIVVAVYPFTAIEEGDLTLTKGACSIVYKI